MIKELKPEAWKKAKDRLIVQIITEVTRCTTE